MNADYLQNLNDAVEQIVRQKTFSEIVEGLKIKLSHSEEPFVWSVIDLGSVSCALSNNKGPAVPSGLSSLLIDSLILYLEPSPKKFPI